MLSDLVLAALRVATRAAVVATRAAVAAPRAIGAFASAAFHDAVAEWVARRALRERRARRAHYAAFAERERVKAKAEAERQRARGKPPPPKARKASAARPRAPKAKAEPAAKPADSEKLDVVPEVVPAEPAGVSYVSPCVSPDDGVGVEESKGGEFGVGVEESKGAEPFEETPSESTEGSSLGAEAPSSSSGRFSSLGTEEEDKLYASLDAELSTAQRRGAARVPALLLALVALVVLTTAAEVGWLVYEHVRRSAAVRRALETAIVLRVCRAVHETQRERGLLSTYVASGGRANALELGQQFLRTDAALDLAVGAALRHADTVRVAGARSGDTDLSPSRTASLLYGAVDVGARRGLYVGGAARWSAPAPFVSLARDGCRRKACARLAALLRHREATERRAGDAAAPDDHLVAFDAYSALNENLLTVARDAAVELMRAGLRAQHLAPSLVASVALAAYKEHAAVERGLVAADLAAHARKRRGRAGAAVSGETRARVARVVTLQESSLQSFLALAPKRFVSAYARHAALDCVHEAAALRGRVLADDEDDADHAEYFALQSCRIDSLQAMMDDLQAAILADALASQRAALWRLLYLGAPLVGVLLAGAYLGLLGLVAFVRYQESVAERLDRLRSAERKYKKLLTTWVPLKERIAGAAPPNEAA
ncbi:hypothetical protein AURANDRAFT_65744 [Aureococcus anophagefferens]|uniref:Nitrate/nitrite sensing protein domain-containing protein n=1 Tax=Aureococcus anophagefferens TaxID=44056 RepID=F0YF11_AURAN|nr:hypothetical protein AURANDRAFT_65744 [Aureococcus anophagefferens]EGB06379.1 hypothetical protein AURANDRAFT_65744 [Aureococcus anophagefferens]|eukprot:XP_009038955.1 hypothetical protein AURANDRAFT_65744 [Aureococcus anophagefferens]